MSIRPGVGGAEFPFDAEPSVTLRNGADAPEVAAVSEAALALVTLGAGTYDDWQLTFLDTTVAIHVTEADVADGDETYAVQVEVSTDEAFTAPIKVGEVIVASTGTYAVELYGPTIERVAPDAAYIRVSCTMAGTSPSLGYYAWIARTLGT